MQRLSLVRVVHQGQAQALTLAAEGKAFEVPGTVPLVTADFDPLGRAAREALPQRCFEFAEQRGELLGVERGSGALIGRDNPEFGVDRKHQCVGLGHSRAHGCSHIGQGRGAELSSFQHERRLFDGERLPSQLDDRGRWGSIWGALLVSDTRVVPHHH